MSLQDIVMLSELRIKVAYNLDMTKTDWDKFIELVNIARGL